MWSITDLKQRAWNVLRDSYRKCFLACFVVSLIIYGAGMISLFVFYMVFAAFMLVLFAAGSLQGNPEAYFSAFNPLFYFGSIFLVLGIGIIFLLSYIKAAEAELYAAMRDKLFYEGTSNPQELPGYPC